MSEQPSSVSELVARIREERRLTQEGLARELGVSFSTVNAWESGRSQPKPRHRHRLEALASGEGSAVSGRSGRDAVLCVDDSPVDLELLASHVRDAASVLGREVDVVTETDGMRALIALGRVEPMVAFVDVVMPGLDGFELADRIAEMPEVRVGHLVLVTAQRDDEMDAQATARDLVLLDKPVTLADVGTALRRGQPSAAA